MITQTEIFPFDYTWQSNRSEQNEYSIIKYGATFDMETTIEIGKDDKYYKL